MKNRDDLHPEGRESLCEVFSTILKSDIPGIQRHLRLYKTFKVNDAQINDDPKPAAFPPEIHRMLNRAAIFCCVAK